MAKKINGFESIVLNNDKSQNTTSNQKINGFESIVLQNRTPIKNDKINEIRQKSRETSSSKENATVKDNVLRESTAVITQIDDLLTRSKKVAVKGKNKWFKSGAFDDGYQFGDVLKTIIGSTSDAAGNAGTGIIGMGEKALDAAIGIGYEKVKDTMEKGLVYALVADCVLTGGKNSKKIVDTIKVYGKVEKKADDKVSNVIAKDLYDEEKIAKKIFVDPLEKVTGVDAEKNSVFAEKSDGFFQSAGQMGGTTLLQMAGVPWWVTTGLTASGDEIENALNQDATLEEAVASGYISAGGEILSEFIMGGPLSKIGLDDLMAKKIGTVFADDLMKGLAKFSIKGAGEGLEEIVSSAISRYGQWLTYYQDEKTLKEMLWSKEAREEYRDVFISGWLLGEAGQAVEVVNAKKNGVDYVTGLTKNEKQVVDKIYQNEIAEAEKDGKELTNKEKNKLYDDVVKKVDEGNISADIIEEVLNDEIHNLVTAIESEIETKSIARLNELGVDKSTAKELSPVVAKEVFGEKLTLEEQETLKSNRVAMQVVKELSDDRANTVWKDTIKNNNVNFFDFANKNTILHLENNDNTINPAGDDYVYEKATYKAKEKATTELTLKHNNENFLQGKFNDSIIDRSNKTTDGSRVNWNSLTPTQKRAINFAQLFSKTTGINIKLIKSDVKNGKHKGKNGSYNPSTNTIEIDVYAGRIDLNSVEDFIIPTLSHELTHWMKDKSPALYNSICQEVIKILTKDSEYSSNEIIAKEMQRMKEAHPDVEVTPKDAIDEIVARACEDMLANSEIARKILDTMSIREQQSFIAKVKELINKLIGKINNLFACYKSSSIEAKILHEYKDKFENLLKQWDDMLVDAINSFNTVNIVEKNYSYDTLISKPDIKISKIENASSNEISLYRENRNLFAKEMIEIANKIGNIKNTNTSTYLYCKDLNKDVLITRNSFKHGAARIDDTYVAVCKSISDVIENSIVVNELKERTKTNGSYILLGMVENDDSYVVVRSIVDKKTWKLEDYNELYAIRKKSIKKEDVGVKAPALPPMTGFGTSSIISVADFLDFVNNQKLANSVLSLDVIERLKSKRGVDENVTANLVYSSRDNFENGHNDTIWKDAIKNSRINDATDSEVLQSSVGGVVDSVNKLNYNDNSIKEGEKYGSENAELLERGAVSAAYRGNNILRKPGTNSRGLAVSMEISQGANGAFRFTKRTGKSGWLDERKNITGEEARKSFDASIYRRIRGVKLSGKDTVGGIVSQEVLERFRNTICKDEKGNLISLYHWTSEIFESFKKGEFGFHFGTLCAAYDRYLQTKEEKPGVSNGVYKEVILNITNPIELREGVGDWNAYWVALQLLKKGVISEREYNILSDIEGFCDNTYDNPAAEAVRNILAQNGYDGIIYENLSEDVGSYSLIALYPEQIITVAENGVLKENSGISRAISETQVAFLNSKEKQIDADEFIKGLRGGEAQEFSQEYIDELLDSFGITKPGDYIHVQKRVMETLESEGFFTDKENRCTKVVNDASGMVVEINKSGIKETFNLDNYARLGKFKKLAKLATIRKLKTIIKQGKIIADNVQNKYNDVSLNKSFGYVEFEIAVDNNKFVVKIAIKKSPQKNKFWVHSIYAKNDVSDSLTSTNSSTEVSHITANTNIDDQNVMSEKGHGTFSRIVKGDGANNIPNNVKAIKSGYNKVSADKKSISQESKNVNEDDMQAMFEAVYGDSLKFSNNEVLQSSVGGVVDSVNKFNYNDNSIKEGEKNDIYKRRGLEPGNEETGETINSGKETGMAGIYGENSLALKRRVEGIYGESGRTVSHLNITVAYKEIGEIDENSPAGIAYNILKSKGYNVVYCEGPILINNNKHTIERTEAVTIFDGTVYISSEATLNSKGVALHEVVHVWQYDNNAEYSNYESVLCEEIDPLCDNYTKLAAQINDNHYNGKYDIGDIGSFKFIMRELAAYISQYVCTNPEYAQKTIRGMFNDWDNVVQAVYRLNKQLGFGDIINTATSQSEDAVFLSENSDLNKNRTNANGIDDVSFINGLFGKEDKSNTDRQDAIKNNIGSTPAGISQNSITGLLTSNVDGSLSQNNLDVNVNDDKQENKIDTDEFIKGLYDEDTNESLSGQYSIGSPLQQMKYGKNTHQNSLKYWYPNMKKSEIDLVKRIAKRELDTTYNYIDNKNKWLYNSFGDKTYFALYSTEDTSEPTVLYACKGERAEFEYTYLLNELQKEANNNENIHTGTGDVIKLPTCKESDISGKTFDNGDTVGRGSNAGDVGLYSKNTRRRASEALLNCLRNIEKARGNVGRVLGRGLNSGQYSLGAPLQELKYGNEFELSEPAIDNIEVSDEVEFLVGLNDVKLSKTQKHIIDICKKLDSNITVEFVDRIDEKGKINGTLIRSQNKILIKSDLNAVQMYVEVFKHEFMHRLETKMLYSKFFNYCFKKSKAFEQYVRAELKSAGVDYNEDIAPRDSVLEAYTKYKFNEYKNAEGIPKIYRDAFTMEMAREEIIADFFAQILFQGTQYRARIIEALENADGEMLIGIGDEISSEAALMELQQKEPTLFEQVKQWIRDVINKLRGISQAESLVEQLDNEINQLESMVRKAYQSKDSKRLMRDKNGEVKCKIMSFNDGTKYVDITTDQDRFNGLTVDEMQKEAKKVIKENFVGKVIGINNRTFVNSRSAGEYSYPSKFIKNPDITEAKMRASTELDNLVEIGTNYRNEPDGLYGHSHPKAKGGFDYYDTIFKVGNRYYFGTVNIMVTDRGKLLKDITKIRDVSNDIIAQYGSAPQGEFVENIPENIISNSERVVNNDDSKRLAKKKLADEKYSFEGYNDAGKGKFGDVFHDINLEVDQILPRTNSASGIEKSTSNGSISKFIEKVNTEKSNDNSNDTPSGQYPLGSPIQQLRYNPEAYDEYNLEISEPSEEDITYAPTAEESIAEAISGEQLDTKQRRILNFAYKHFGINVKFSSNMSKDGLWDPESKTLLLNTKLSVKGMYISVFKHEFMHRLESKRLYQEFKQFLFNKDVTFGIWVKMKCKAFGIELPENTTTKDAINALADYYYKTVKNDKGIAKKYRDAFTVDDAQREMAADFFGEILFNGKKYRTQTAQALADETFLTMFDEIELAEFEASSLAALKEIAEYKPNIFKEIIDWVKRIILKLRGTRIKADAILADELERNIKILEDYVKQVYISRDMETFDGKSNVSFCFVRCDNNAKKSKADMMLKEGASDTEIYEELGLFKNVFGEWAFALDLKKYYFYPYGNSSTSYNLIQKPNRIEGVLRDVVYWKELFDLFPEFEKVRLIIRDSDNPYDTVRFIPTDDGGMICVNKKLCDEYRKSSTVTAKAEMLKAIQNMIQFKEGNYIGKSFEYWKELEQKGKLPFSENLDRYLTADDMMKLFIDNYEANMAARRQYTKDIVIYQDKHKRNFEDAVFYRPYVNPDSVIKYNNKNELVTLSGKNIKRKQIKKKLKQEIVPVEPKNILSAKRRLKDFLLAKEENSLKRQNIEKNELIRGGEGGFLESYDENQYQRFQKHLKAISDVPIANEDTIGRYFNEIVKERMNGSIMISEKGEPLSLYAISLNDNDLFKDAQLGVRLTTISAISEMYSENEFLPNVKCIECYAVLKNPFYFKGEPYELSVGEIGLQLAGEGVITWEEYIHLMNMKSTAEGNGYNNPAIKRMRKKIIEAGYDGLIFENKNYDRGGMTVVAFYENQLIPVAKDGMLIEGNGITEANYEDDDFNTFGTTVKENRENLVMYLKESSFNNYKKRKPVDSRIRLGGCDYLENKNIDLAQIKKALIANMQVEISGYDTAGRKFTKRFEKVLDNCAFRSSNGAILTFCLWNTKNKNILIATKKGVEFGTVNSAFEKFFEHKEKNYSGYNGVFEEFILNCSSPLVLNLNGWNTIDVAKYLLKENIISQKYCQELFAMKDIGSPTYSSYSAQLLRDRIKILGYDCLMFIKDTGEKSVIPFYDNQIIKISENGILVDDCNAFEIKNIFLKSDIKGEIISPKSATQRDFNKIKDEILSESNITNKIKNLTEFMSYKNDSLLKDDIDIKIGYSGDFEQGEVSIWRLIRVYNKLINNSYTGINERDTADRLVNNQVQHILNYTIFKDEIRRPLSFFLWNKYGKNRFRHSSLGYRVTALSEAHNDYLKEKNKHPTLLKGEYEEYFVNAKKVYVMKSVPKEFISKEFADEFYQNGIINDDEYQRVLGMHGIDTTENHTFAANYLIRKLKEKGFDCIIYMSEFGSIGAIPLNKTQLIPVTINGQAIENNIFRFADSNRSAFFIDKIKNNVEKKDADILDDLEDGEYNEKVIGLTEEEKQKIKQKTGWSDGIINFISSMEEAQVYIDANLKEVEINGIKCLIRSDIDMDYVDSKGLTNRERMRRGKAPQTANGEEIHLHHIGQKQNSPLAELTKSEHLGKGNYSILHDTKKSSEIKRSKFKSKRKKHWKIRFNIGGYNNE